MIFHQITYNKCNTSGYKNNKKALRFRADQYDGHWQSKLSSFSIFINNYFTIVTEKPIVHYFLCFMIE